MHIHVHLIRGQLQEQKRNGVTARHQQSAIGFLQSVAKASVTNPPAIQEQVLELGIAALASWIGDVAAERHGPLLRFQRVRPIAHLGSKEESEPIEQRKPTSYFVQRFTIVS